MAGWSRRRAADPHAEFEKMRLAYINGITEDLQEAAELLAHLNQNLAYWAQKTGEVDKLALVWGKFQNQLSVLSGLVDGHSDMTDLTSEFSDSLSGEGVSSSMPTPSAGTRKSGAFK